MKNYERSENSKLYSRTAIIIQDFLIETMTSLERFAVISRSVVLKINVSKKLHC